MTNNFRDIPGFEGFYQCNIIDGTVESCDRTVVYSDGRTYHYKRRVRMPSKCSGREHLQIVLSKNGVNYHTYVHDVVAKTFPEICGTWFEGCVVHHIDGNPENNAPTNLTVLTRGQHVLEHPEVLERAHEMSSIKGKGHPNYNTGPYKTGKDHHSSKKILVYNTEFEIIGCYDSASEAAKAIGCSVGLVSHCCTGKRKSCKNFYCEYL
jgi:hypothetical protein